MVTIVLGLDLSLYLHYVVFYTGTRRDPRRAKRKKKINVYRYTMDFIILAKVVNE